MKEIKISSPVSTNVFIIDVEKSPQDSRDYIAESILQSDSIPKSLDLRKDLFPVRNQGNQGSCSAQTAACIKEWQEKKDVNLDEYLSPQFIYNNRENQNTSGMYPRDTMKILNKIGIYKERYYPYGKIESKENISKDILEKAAKFKIKSYALVNTIDGLKKALYTNGPCYISVPVYNSSTEMWKPNGEMRGGHAMTVVGYNSKGFIIRNSWGENWGDKGYCIFPYTDWGYHWEVWTTIDEESNYTPKKRWFTRIKAFFKSIGTLLILPLFFQIGGILLLIEKDKNGVIPSIVLISIGTVLLTILGIKNYNKSYEYK